MNIPHLYSPDTTTCQLIGIEFPNHVLAKDSNFQSFLFRLNDDFFHSLVFQSNFCILSRKKDCWWTGQILILLGDDLCSFACLSSSELISNAFRHILPLSKYTVAVVVSRILCTVDILFDRFQGNLVIFATTTTTSANARITESITSI